VAEEADSGPHNTGVRGGACFLINLLKLKIFFCATWFFEVQKMSVFLAEAGGMWGLDKSDLSK
jgi:hypothetical protein